MKDELMPANVSGGSQKTFALVGTKSKRAGNLRGYLLLSLQIISSTAKVVKQASSINEDAKNHDACPGIYVLCRAG
jgi:hypothetical protein